MPPKKFKVGDQVQSAVKETSGKLGTITAVDGKTLSVRWKRGNPTEETSRRLTLVDDPPEQPQTDRKRKASPTSKAASIVQSSRAKQSRGEDASESESDNSDQHDSEASDEERGIPAFRDQPHHDMCHGCGRGGTLYECDFCDCAWHEDCLELPGDVPDIFKCPACRVEEAAAQADEAGVISPSFILLC